MWLTLSLIKSQWIFSMPVSFTHRHTDVHRSTLLLLTIVVVETIVVISNRQWILMSTEQNEIFLRLHILLLLALCGISFVSHFMLITWMCGRISLLCYLNISCVEIVTHFTFSSYFTSKFFSYLFLSLFQSDCLFYFFIFFTMHPRELNLYLQFPHTSV